MANHASSLSPLELAQYIDYAILNPDFTEAEILEYAKKGIAYQVKSLCINPLYLKLLAPLVQGTMVELCPVIDFPFGASSTASRIAQLQEVIRYEAVKEIDIVIHIGMLKDKKTREIVEDLKAVTKAAHNAKRQMKVILETDALSEEEMLLGAKCIVEAGADFVKTSTSYLTGTELSGATPEKIALLLKAVGDQIKIKASGGVRSRERFLTLLDLGVARCGVGHKSLERLFIV